MAKIAFIGLGIMGAPMARNLLAAGHDVVGHNRSPNPTRAFEADGGRGADTIADAVRDAEVVCTMLPDSRDVEAVMVGDEGVLAHARPGTLLIDFSTIRPDVGRSLASRADARGLPLVDAPVSGGDVGAAEGTLSIMVGGKAETVARARPFLETVGRTVTHVGPAGAGQTVKAANQLVVAGNIAMVAEAIVFLEGHGVDVEAALAAIGGGLAGSRVMELRGGSMVERSFEPGFRAELHHKDLGIVASSAREAGVSLPVAALVAQLMGTVVAQGNGSCDHSALLTALDRLQGDERNARRETS